MFRQPRGGRVTKKIHHGGGHSVFFPFEAPSADVETKEFAVNTSNFEYFHGYNNSFTLQYWTDVSIDDIVYKSVDHYYQKMKVFDLTGTASEKFDDPKVKNYSGVAREVLREHNISRKTVDDWRTTCGVEIVQKAILEKVKQSTAFRDHLLATGDKIICQPFPLDDFFGTGCPIKYVQDWAKSMQEKNSKLIFPVNFPLTNKISKSVPSVAKGRNMLGAIYMALREQIKNGKLEELSVALTPVSEFVKVKKRTAPPPSSRQLPPPTTNAFPPASLSSANAIPVGGHIAAAPAPMPLRDVAAPNGYAGYAGGQAPMMYTAEQQQQYQNNQPSIASQLPEVPVGPDLRYFNNPRIPAYHQQQPAAAAPRQPPPPQTRPPVQTPDQMYANYQSQQQGMQYQQPQYQQPLQGPRPPQQPTYASLAAQNQDFSMDVDPSSASSMANTQVTRQHFTPASSGNQSMYQGQYDWQW